MRGVIKYLGLLTLVLSLSSCYIPDKFRSELRLSRFGDWSLSYDGDFIYAPILHDYANKTISAADEPARHENIRRDLSRDPAVKSVEARGKGRFAVHYERMGRLEKSQLVALIRRDSRMLSIRSFDNGAITVRAAAIKPADARRIAEMGLDVTGEFRITTDANVVEHNAGEVRPFGAFRVYVWKIENPLSPPPRLTMIRDMDPGRPLK